MMKRLAALLLILCLILGTGLPGAPGSARADSFTVYVSANTLPVYNKTSTSGKLLGTMSYGESMLCLAHNNTWAAVQNGAGKIGYCKISGLTITDPNNISKTAYITANDTPVYRKPSLNAGVMATLKKNSSYTAVAITTDGDWVRLKNGKYYGYVQTSKLSTSAVTDPDADTTQKNTTVYIISNTLKAYDKASTSGKVLGTMSYGESMTLLATSGEWARIRNSSGATGYCKASGLSTSNPNNQNQKIYIKSDGVKVYKKPSTSAKVMMSLKQNSSYTCVAITADGNWARLKNGSAYGYVQTKYISNLQIEEPETETPQDQTVYVSSNTLDIHKSADDTSKKLGTMSFGESLTLLNVSDGWAQVKNAAGVTGYCMYGGITTVNPNTLNAAYYTAEDGVKFYSKPLTSANVVKTAAMNTSVMAVALSEDAVWARVNLGGSYAYVQLAQLSESKVAVDDGTIQDIPAKTMYVSSTTLVCYKENSTSSATLGTMSFGESLKCNGTGDGWARVVNSSGETGYCKLDGLSEKNPNTYNVTMYAQSSGVKVYKKASTSSTVLATIGLNSKVTAVAISPDKEWVRLKSDSEYGYAKASDLATTEVQSSDTSDTAAKIIALAKEQMGIKYVFGAQSPSSGFDCSGLTYYVFKKVAGISLKRTAYTQGYNDNYPKITKVSDLKVGDLVFFNTVSDDNDLCDHVGIYMGNRKFIHASSGAGKVTVSEISTSNYYARTFSWGRRILT